MKKFLVVLIVFLLLGCAHVISSNTRAKVDTDLSHQALFSNPESSKGKTVMLGGVIVSSRNEEKGTYIEVLEKPLGSRGRPEDTDISRGRFIILHDGYLETSIYSKGREVTVVGEIIDVTEGKVGEMQYNYPLVKAEELYLRKPGGGVPVRFSIGIWHVF